MLENLTSYVKVAQSMLPLSVASGGATEIAVDGTGFDRVCHVLIVGAMAATADIQTSIWESAATGGTYTVVAGTISTIAFAGSEASYELEAPISTAKLFQ